MDLNLSKFGASVDASNKKLVIDHLRELFPESSRRTLEGWVKAQRVYMGDRIARHLNEPVLENEEVSVGKKPHQKMGRLPILFQDNDIVVIDKPAGLLSVKSDMGKENTAHDMIKASVKGKVFVIHRLDKDTSGVMIFALSERAFTDLKEQFAKRTAGRTYGAVVEGEPSPRDGRWESYLLDEELIVTTTNNSEMGRLAIADYTTLESGKNLSFLKVKLKTGRKNQIRVQAQEAGCPVVGDKKYGGSQRGRLALHAARLEFCHPTTNRPMVFLSDIPRHMLAPFRKKALICETFRKSP